MGIVELGDDLGISNDFAIHNEVRYEFANEMASIINRIFPLLLNSTPARLQLYDERIFIQFLIQTGFEFVQNRHRSANDIFSDYFVEREKKVTANRMDFTDQFVSIRVIRVIRG